MKTRQLPVTLTDDETKLRGQALARTIKAIDETELGRVESNKNFKSELERLEIEKHVLSNTVNNGFEYRDVQVEERPNHEKKVVETFRLDTGDRVDVRAMREDEMQEELFRVVPHPGAMGSGSTNA
jgi:hypothetical protein